MFTENTLPNWIPKSQKSHQETFSPSTFILFQLDMEEKCAAFQQQIEAKWGVRGHVSVASPVY